MTCCQVQEAIYILQGLYIPGTTGLPFNAFQQKNSYQTPGLFHFGEEYFLNIIVEVEENSM